MKVWRLDYEKNFVTQEVPDIVITPAGLVGDPHNLEYNAFWSYYFPLKATLVKVRGYYTSPWFKNWPNVGPSPAPYTMMAVKFDPAYPPYQKKAEDFRVGYRREMTHDPYA